MTVNSRHYLLILTGILGPPNVFLFKTILKSSTSALHYNLSSLINDYVPEADYYRYTSELLWQVELTFYSQFLTSLIRTADISNSN